MPDLRWGDPNLELTFVWSESTPVSLTAVRSSSASLEMPDAVPFVEVITADAGHTSASRRLDHTRIGRDLRYVSHEQDSDEGSSSLRIHQRDDAHGLHVTIELHAHHGTGAVSARVHLSNSGGREAVLLSVTSWSSAFGGRTGGDSAFDTWTLTSGTSEWLAEGRWSSSDLRLGPLPAIAEDLTGHDRRSALTQTSSGTWSTSGGLPVAGVESSDQRAAWAWQIEHNGGWRWDVAENIAGGIFSLSGPTDTDHAFTKILRPGDRFSSVPVTVALASDIPDAVASLTRHRRRSRRAHSDNAAMPVIYNDYMNTLSGDPSSEKLHPLIAAAADAGAEVFCVDAGWYDDSGSWWGSVGEWMPSARRFPGGLAPVTDDIRERGMIAGLWLEPEVIGVRSPIAASLPDDAFFQRHGARVEEHERFHLDVRHPAARAHLDAVVDRLVADLGVGYFKFDYNINPGSGTDVRADSVGDGLLQHNRAHLEWLDGVLDRHPDLIIENCASGAMRMDYALLSRLQLQSTSDQQDFRLYPPIAASAPMSMLPEQAANWSYPDPEMGDEEVAFCLVTGLLGRFYLSGFLDRLSPDRFGLVREAVAAAKTLRPGIQRSTPLWPLGLPSWTSPWVALGLALPDASETCVSVWRRHGSDAPLDARLQLPLYRGRDVAVDTVFPAALPAWSVEWDAATGTLGVRAAEDVTAARTFRVRPR
ncbi:alpha-galactosidase [Microbacterium sp. DT81.1]|uniref:alpha-galactosidase n=1 Tax=Microbacterium sp. DT81.1 TaxID=3393413 RepID=UPI003CEE660F